MIFSSRRLFFPIFTFCSLSLSVNVFAHSDFDKSRFVAQSGSDQGNCDNRFRPCQTIAYAYSRANKGDVILVAQGQYSINERVTEALMSSNLVTIRGGYSLSDHYQVQHPSLHVTRLVSVPTGLTQALYDSGFTLIADGKNQVLELVDINQAETSAPQVLASATEQACVDSSAGNFACDNIDLLSQLSLADLPTNSATANDIWGHVDLNTGREYAIIGLRQGVAVVDVSEPTSPTVVGSISGLATTWRDIKVLQTYNADLSRWQAWAYVTADSLNTGLVIIDLNDLENGVSVAAQDSTDLSAHNVYISGVDYSLNIPLRNATPQLNILGGNNFGGAVRSYDISQPTNPSPSFTPLTALRNDYTHDASSLEISDSRAQSNCGLNNGESCSVLLDFNEGTLRVFDSTDVSNTRLLSEVSYNNVEYTHSGWWSEDQRFVFVHDELDEVRLGLNTTLHIFDIADLQAPELVGTWVGDTGAIDHNGFVRGNRYYMSNYERGLTVLDMSDPSTPSEIGFFDTFPLSDNTAFNGAWGVYPYLPSGNILVSDISRGLFVLRDNTVSSSSTLSIQTTLEVEEGQSASLTVSRVNGVAAATVEYSLLPGSASVDDVSAITGELSWGANDNQERVINFDIQEDDIDEADETFFVVLHNPQDTFISGSARIATVNIAGMAQRGQAVIAQSELSLLENQSAQTLSVTRTGGSQDVLTVPVTIEPEALREDISVSPSSLTWQDGETTTFSITLTPVNDTLSEGEEIATIRVGDSSATVTILDDESNTAPLANAGDDITANARAVVEVRGSGTDADNDTLSYTWTQTSGTQVTLANSDTPTTQFTAPNEQSTIELQLTVSDIFGAQSSDSVTVEVSAPVADNPPADDTPIVATNDSSGGGSTSLGMHWYLLVLLAFRRIYKVKKNKVLH